MRGDESQLEAAGEKAQHQQHIAFMPEGFRQSLRDGLFGSRTRRFLTQRTGGQRDRQRQHQQQGATEQDRGFLPADRIDQRAGNRGKQELSERAGRRARAERNAAPLFWQDFAESRQHHVERATRQTEADQPACRHRQTGRRIGIGHHHLPQPVKQSPDTQHPCGAETVGHRPCEGLADAPEQVLDRHREGEHLAAPAMAGRHRDLEQADRRPRPEGHHADQTARRQNQQRRIGPHGCALCPVALRLCHVIRPLVSSRNHLGQARDVSALPPRPAMV